MYGRRCTSSPIPFLFPAAVVRLAWIPLIYLEPRDIHPDLAIQGTAPKKILWSKIIFDTFRAQ